MRFATWAFTLGAAFLVLASPAPLRAEQNPAPIKPLGNDGKPLNLDFETGTLKDWTPSGNAFDGQPVHGDTVHPRRGSDRSAHQGEFWIGGYELKGDDGIGTLTSVPFKAAHPWASFLVGGGHWAEERVEIVTADDQKVFFKTSAADREEMRPVVVDLSKIQGKEIFVRLVDDRKGGWGHINFDDFEFYDQKPQFATELLKNEVAKTGLPSDYFEFHGLPPDLAARVMTMPSGFKAELVAGEPDIVQPIAFTIDARGRLWVVEGMTYPVRAPEGQGQDRILIFSGDDGSGHFTHRTVFKEGLNLVSGIEVGFGGVWVGAAPYLMFIPADINADEPKPAAEPQILLDGFGYQDTHETLNTFCWGPDGWLYGCHGVFTQSNVGVPGASPKDRIHLNCGIWRYHPTKHIFERFCEGTSNPWGVDFDDKGQIIIEACVIPHLWHMIQGAHYQRQGGQHDNPYVYDDIKTIADHVHYAGTHGPHAGNGHSDAAGGGHAHAGLMVYLGGSWPQQFVGQYFMNNIHGARINMDVPEAKGSGFVGHHGKDFILFNDLWSQIINLRYDQDGSVYMIDWYDKNQCHNPRPEAHDRTNGRIFKIVYGDTKTTPVDLTRSTDLQLVEDQLDPHEWRVREARRVLQERAALGKLDPAVVPALVKILTDNPDESRELRALWALHCVGGLTQELALRELKSDKPYVAAWTIQLLCEAKNAAPEAVAEFDNLARSSPSPVVRLYLASAVQRMPLEQRWNIVASLISHGEDAEDHNLPLMDWYALEPLCAADPQRALALAVEAKVPRILSFAVRRIGAMGGNASDALVAALGRIQDAPRRIEILNGLRESLQGRRTVPMPPAWKEIEPTLLASADAELKAQARALAITFGSAAAIDAARQTLVSDKAPAAERLAALDSLVGIHDAGLAATLQSLLRNPELRGPALRGLAGYDDASTPPAILKGYPSYDPSERKDALITLASRQASASALLSAIESGQVPSKDVSADIVRQLRTLKDKTLDERVVKVWGILRDSPADKVKRIAQLKSLVGAAGKEPDLSHGRLLFTKTCMQCHTLYGVGGHVGPDLTGSNRSDIDYILEHAVDPNAIIPADYRTTQIETTDDRTILGIVKKEDDKSLTIVMPNQDLILPKSEIKSRRLSALGMMPEGLLDTFPDADIRDLIAYLRARSQVSLAPEAAGKK